MKLCLNILGILSILLIVCLVIVIFISYIENRKLVVTKYSIYAKNIPKAFHGFHIVQLSDLHNAQFGEQNCRLINQVSNLKPDVILVTGDMLIGKPGCDSSIAVNTLNALCEIAPVYFSMGNHELRASIYTDTYGDMWEQFKHSLSDKVNLLLDDRAELIREDAHIYLYGLNLTPQLYKRVRRTPMENNYLEGLFGTAKEKDYHIFMAHNPDYFKDYVSWGADLVFSGHVHGGMLRIPFLGGVVSPMVHLFPHYDKGLFEESNKYMILSGGLGNHTFKFRVNNLPEIVSVTLNQETI